MSPLAEKILREFQERGWNSEPHLGAMELARTEPDSLLAFAGAVIERLPDSPTFYQDALSWLPERDWPALVELALAACERGENEAAQAAIAFAALQDLPALHPHLERIFRLTPNADTYYAQWPWRQSGLLNRDFLLGVLNDSSAPADDRERAWKCLLETREPELIEAALLRAPEVLDDAGDAELHLREVGFSTDTGALRRLYPERVLHLVFPDGYLEEGGPAWLQRHHPTWNPDSGDAPMQLGGMLQAACGSCGGSLCRLLALDPVPDGIGVSGPSRLTLGTCIACLGWRQDILFYQHDSSGLPATIGCSAGGERPLPAGVLKEGEVRLADAGPRWRWQDWGLSNGRQNLHRAGGFPCWVQSAEHPECPSCRRLMPFLLHLDSGLPTDDGGELSWGSGGIAYLFWCDGCRVSAALWQCT